MIKKESPQRETQILESGLCQCIREPLDGEYGLEGYNQGSNYRYEKLQHNRGKLITYYRIYPDDTELESSYYETCGPEIFKKFFQVNQKENS